MALTLAAQKNLTTRNTHVKYESSMTNHSKVMANVKGFCGKTDRQMDRQGKNYRSQIYQCRGIKGISNHRVGKGENAGNLTYVHNIFYPFQNKFHFWCHS